MIMKRRFALLGGAVSLALLAGLGFIWWCVLPACAASKPLTPNIQAAEVARYFEKVMPKLHLSHQPLD